MGEHVVAIDVGGTSMKGALVDRLGRVSALERRPTGRSATVVEDIRRFAGDLIAHGDAAAVGIAVPGLVDSVANVALYSANLGWRDVPAADFVPDGVPVALAHDVRAGGVAEGVYGAGRGVTDFLCLPIGTGMAAAMVLGGSAYAGSRGWGGEIGHTPVWPDGEPCACGQRGCLENYASASAIARRHGGGLTAEQVVAAADEDPVAKRVLDEAVEALGIGLATYTLLLDPALIVIGGGLAGAGERLLAPVRAALASRLAFREAPPVRATAIGPHAGMMGAAILAWRAAGHPDAGSDWS
ncbi:ROK family protein [Bailinhaonella thermotolerans]|uniref:ROK family protein n=1 Tax=Bailinhaonella thermotolerans TaxID=1070861 RepID=A0A3A4BSR8_9ACTN|nr:ROK family protein [Bailinhaonella thermotolerans]RJL34356.1 ROK family protein [Bailinhaonella thermotolerans]